MSGRPAVLYRWTMTGNFPAGGNLWNSQPLALQPAGTYFVPNVKPDAEEMNWLMGTLTTDDQIILDWAGNDPAVNWYAPLTAATFTGQTEIGAARWAPLAQLWLLGTGNHGTPSVQVWTAPGNGADGFAEWSTLGASITPSTSGHITALAEDGVTAGQYWMTIADDSGNQKVWKYPVGGPWASQHTNSTATFGNPELATANIGGNSVIVVATPQASAALISHSVNGGTTWVDFATTVEVDRFYLQWNGSLFVAVASSTVVANGHYWTSPDGATWTARTLPTTVVGSSGANAPVGLAWNNVANLWTILTNVSGGGLCIATSPDGITWNVVTTLGVSTPVMADLAAIGALLVVTVQDTAGGSSAMYFNTDGGTTWYKVNAGFASNVATTQHYYQRTRVWASAQGFIATNTNLLRESHVCAQPVAHL
jgi:hypothetical protein